MTSRRIWKTATTSNLRKYLSVDWLLSTRSPWKAQETTSPFGDESPVHDIDHIPISETTCDEPTTCLEMLYKGLSQKGGNLSKSRAYRSHWKQHTRHSGDFNRRSGRPVIVNCGITTRKLPYSLATDLYIANHLIWKDAEDDMIMNQWFTKL